MIDTHVHVWNFKKAAYDWLEGDTSVLNRTYHLHEVEIEMAQVGITGAVLVQAANNLEDTNWMLEVAQTNNLVAGVVGWLPLLQPGETEALLNDKYKRNHYFKGVRHLIHNEADPKWLLQEEVLESLKLLAARQLRVDIVGVLPAHIETALKVAEKVPGLQMVFDHLNQPPVPFDEKWSHWCELLKEAAANENFYAKISGLGTTVNKQNWGVNDITPCVAFALETFGTDRCFCGGDWPVSLLAGTYTETWKNYNLVIQSLLDKKQQQKVFTENAVRFYRLNVLG